MILSDDPDRRSHPDFVDAVKDVQFEQTRKALQSKQKGLKLKGKGNNPNASASLSEEDIQVLYEKDLLGSSTAETLLNTALWFNNTIHFGLRKCKEHKEMCWGDLKLCQTATGQKYFEFNERETKTRSGNDPRNVRAIALKMFSVPNNEKCIGPVKAYKVYLRRKATRGNENRRCTVFLGSNQCKIWLRQTLVQKISSRSK